MSKSDEKIDYSVGYGKPPSQHRFRKGQSGNPKGRPRKATEKPKQQRFRDGRLDSLLEQEAFRALLLNENGKPIEMSAAQAVLRSLLLDGVKGNRLAKKYAFEMLRQEERDALQRSIEHYNHFERKKKEGEAKIADCERRGVPPPQLFPHPRDILLDETKLEVHVLGPLTADQAIPFERAALVRDWLLTYSVLEEKLGKVTLIEHNGETAATSSVLAMMVDRSLPPSFRRNDASMLGFLVDLHGLTKRRLRQQMKTLMGQIAKMPESVDEQLAARDRAAEAIGGIAADLEKLAAEFTEKQRPNGHAAAPSPKEDT